MTIFEAQRRIHRIDLIQIIAKILKQDEKILIDLNKKQLYKGKLKDGNPIRPIYQSDNYARLKNTLTPDPERSYYTPNLYLTGHFYSTIYIKITDQIISFGSNDELATKLEEKYSNLIYGLNADSKKQYIDNHLWPQIKQYLNVLFN